MTDWLVTSYDSSGRQVGSFTVSADTLSGALSAAAKHGELLCRPLSSSIRITRLKTSDRPSDRPQDVVRHRRSLRDILS